MSLTGFLPRHLLHSAKFSVNKRLLRKWSGRSLYFDLVDMDKNIVNNVKQGNKDDMLGLYNM